MQVSYQVQPRALQSEVLGSPTILLCSCTEWRFDDCNPPSVSAYPCIIVFLPPVVFSCKSVPGDPSMQ